MSNLIKSVNSNLVSLNKLKLPNEWIQMFRILLSIYLLWIILLATRKQLFNDNFITRMVFIILLVLLSQTDIICGLLLLLIYFFSFQPILPMINDDTNNNTNNTNNTNNNNEYFEPTMKPKSREISQMINENLQKDYQLPKKTEEPQLRFNFDKDMNFEKQIIKNL
jgi:hypothetical protein